MSDPIPDPIPDPEPEPTPTWEESLITDLAGLGDEFNTVLEAAGLPTLTSWYAGELRPFKLTDTPYGWFHYASGGQIEPTRRKREVGSEARFWLVLAIGGSSSEELLTRAAQMRPLLAAHLESRTWPCNAEIGGWELAGQDDDQYIDLHVLELRLTWWREIGAVA